MTLAAAYQHYIVSLKSLYSPGEAAIIANWVFEVVAGAGKSALLAGDGVALSPATTINLEQKLAQLLAHKPVQYVLGEAWFYRMRWLVNENVLVPRPETEELVEYVAAQLGSGEGRQVLDIGTGSGCIAVTLKKLLPAAAVTAVDVSEGALAVARANAVALGAAVDWVLLDFLNRDNWPLLGQYDAIVSNPPYIPRNEKEKLDANVVAYEPGLALFVPDDNPLLFYEAIAAFGLLHLKPVGFIAVEIHENYAQQTAALFAERYETVNIRKDLSGKERMVIVNGQM